MPTLRERAGWLLFPSYFAEREQVRGLTNALLEAYRDGPYELPPEEEKGIATVCASLDEALESLDNDREFLLAGDVFTNDVLDAYIELKMEELTRFRMTTHPVEFDMYYSL